jgi:hypothetical protein
MSFHRNLKMSIDKCFSEIFSSDLAITKLKNSQLGFFFFFFFWWDLGLNSGLRSAHLQSRNSYYFESHPPLVYFDLVILEMWVLPTIFLG